MPPLVSIVITTYNQAEYIRATLASVFAQTYSPSEIILVDDGSGDDTGARVSEFRERLTYIAQPNQGVAAARNTGVAHATGELIAFLDGDDLWESQKLALQVAAAQRHPEAGLIVANGTQVDYEGRVLRDFLVAGAMAGRVTGTQPLTLWCHDEFLEGNPVATTSQVMVPSHVLRTVGLSDVRFPIASDWDLYIRITERYPATFLPQKLTRWRYLPTSASGPLELRPLRWACDEIRILRKHLRSAPPRKRSVIATILERKIRSTAEVVYYGNLAGRLTGGRRYLLGLLLRNASSLTLAKYLLALSMPQPVVARAARLLRGLGGR